MTTHALDQEQRVCLTDGCGTVLSRHNSARICQACSSRLEQGGPLIRQPRYEPRPPPPTRPVLEGAVPLPGVVPGRERTYAEMIAPSKPAAPVATKPACAECGADLPKGHQGWLCHLCVAAAALPVAHSDTSSLETPATQAASQSEPDSKADSKAPAPRPKKTLKPRAESQTKRIRGLVKDVDHREGPKPGRRKFDYDEAARLYRETGSYSEVARRLGASQQSVSQAVKRILGADVAAAIKPPTPSDPATTCRRRGCETPATAQSLRNSTKGRWYKLCEHHKQLELDHQRERRATESPGPRGGSARQFDWDAAARMFTELGSYAEVARHVGVSAESVRAAVRDVLGPDGAREAKHAAKLARQGVDVTVDPNAVRTAFEGEKPEVPPTPVAPPAEDPTPTPARLDLPPLAELDAELSRLELELEHIGGELGRLYARQGAASKRMSEVIGLMAQSARSAA